jgi:phosphatidylglycerophosphate synthase
MPHSLRARAAGAHAAGLAAVAALAVAARLAIPLSPWFPLKAAACFALVGLVAVARISRANHAFAAFGPPNQVTAARAAGVALVAAVVGETPQPSIALAAALAAAAVTVLDGVDGWLARRSGMASAFGARFDMEVDALLILALSALAWTLGKAGAWVLASGLLRYAFVAAGWAWPWMDRPLPASLRRKTVCVVQIVALIAVVAPFVPPSASAPVAAGALAVLAASFLTDTAWLARRRREAFA